MRPFRPDDVPAAGRLLAARHAAHRRAEPLLDPAYEDPARAAAEVEAAVAAGATGAVAAEDGEVTGYLLGQPKQAAHWGPNVWVESAGQAVTDAETVRDLYAVAATEWVAQGRDAHYVLVPASDAALVDAWFRLGFGQQHVHGIREVPDSSTYQPPEGIVLRAPTEADVPVLARLDLELPRHQGLAPTFSAGSVPSLEECVTEWHETIAEPEWWPLVAEVDGTVVGSVIGSALTESSTHTGLARPEHAGFLAFAVVSPAAPGPGVGQAQGAAQQARTKGAG